MKTQKDFTQKKYVYRSPNRLRREKVKRRAYKRVGLCLGCVLVSMVIFFFSTITMICHGPSLAARDLFVVSVMETSAAKFLARIYFTPNEIQEIIAGNSVEESSQITNTDLIHISDGSQEENDKNAIEIIDVKGDTFKGKMMIVHDPSRVYVATPPVFGAELAGMRVEEMVARDGAVAGVNGGGFLDEGGVGLGGQPLGIVIQKGQLISGGLGQSSTVVGFDQNDHLIVGQMTGAQALEHNLRDAVSFGPVLVVNGEPAEVSGTGGGLNPRTAIGQRSDGAVLILVVDGRQAHSIGATYNDLVDVMLDFGAVNAANLDGGSSSLMVYQGEIITTCASLYGSRKLPTAILVR